MSDKKETNPASACPEAECISRPDSSTSTSSNNSSSSNFTFNDDSSTSSRDGNLDELEREFTDKLKLDVEKDASKSSCQQSSSKEKLKEEVNVDTIVNLIKNGKCHNIIFMCGAGISTSAGIPDFRSPDTGLFNQLEKYDLPYPEAVFDISFFKTNPKPFFHLARELFPGNFKPTPCHYFMKLIHDKELLLRVYSQNIDSLERIAGVPGDKLVEAHGTFHTGHCINKRCRKEYSFDWMKNIVMDKNREDNVPTCTDCGSTVKPDIIFYGENLPERFYTLLESDFIRCDLLIIMGTSLTVQPFAGLIDLVGPEVPRLIINKTKPEGIERGSFLSRLLGDFKFRAKNNKRDVFMKSETDPACFQLADKLGWREELEKLIANDEKK